MFKRYFISICKQLACFFFILYYTNIVFSDFLSVLSEFENVLELYLDRETVINFFVELTCIYLGIATILSICCCSIDSLKVRKYELKILTSLHVMI